MSFLPDVSIRKAPHHSSRRGREPEACLIHYTAGGSARSTTKWFCMAQSKVSAHFVISRAGVITQLVSLDRASWHAGRAEMADANGEMFGDVNRRTIGIELANRGFLHNTKGGVFYEQGRIMRRYKGPSEPGVLGFDNGYTVTGLWEPYPQEQIDGLHRLLVHIKKAGYNRATRNLLGHEDVALPLGRKIDPGPLFPWEQFTRGDGHRT